MVRVAGGEVVGELGELAFGEWGQHRAHGEYVGGVELDDSESFEAFEACPEFGAATGEADPAGE
jgi:hypothetical protein